MWSEFKKFALKGNVLDLAVGVIIGGAFGKIVSSLVADLIMPIVGLLLGGVDFSKPFYYIWKSGYKIWCLSPNSRRLFHYCFLYLPLYPSN